MILVIRRYLLILPIVLIISCGKTQKVDDAGYGVKSDSVVSENTMICLLTDIHILEAALSQLKNEGTQTDNLNAKLYQGIFKKYHIRKKNYEISLKYYNQNPQEFAKLYTKVINRLELQQKRFTPQR